MPLRLSRPPLCACHLAQRGERVRDPNHVAPGVHRRQAPGRAALCQAEARIQSELQGAALDGRCRPRAVVHALVCAGGRRRQAHYQGRRRGEGVRCACFCVSWSMPTSQAVWPHTFDRRAGFRPTERRWRRQTPTATPSSTCTSQGMPSILTGRGLPCRSRCISCPTIVTSPHSARGAFSVERAAR